MFHLMTLLNRPTCIGAVLCLILGFLWPTGLSAEDATSLELTEPDMSGGKPFMEALKARKTTREFRRDQLSDRRLSNLLWAAFGVNREATGGRTAPSAMGAQEIDLYVARADGFYLYDAKSHRLKRLLTDDLRPLTGGQAFAKEAPVTIVFVADLTRLTRANTEQREFYAAVDTGFISQNVYLFCASEGLATVVHDLNRKPLAEAMQLRPDQRIILAQAVGHPK